ncbi:hypothetical protein M405DRAFT_817362 [Rhizopogon salebrosus TDB-379]|nr:hypothetical protein M405DRAFT_817362 [Rhizopogon salebrosus TDB-379]
MCTIFPALDLKFRVDSATHSLTKPGMCAYYMQLTLYSRYWFTFPSSIAFRSSRDLEIACWVNQRDSNGRVSFGSNYAHISKTAMS